MSQAPQGDDEDEDGEEPWHWFTVPMSLALTEAVGFLEVRFHDACEAFSVEDGAPDLEDFVLYLPSGYPYTPRVLQRIFFCLITVSARLEPLKRKWAQGRVGEVGCACLAEELMLRAIGLEAERLLADEWELLGVGPDDANEAKWWVFHDVAFEDADFEVLFESEGDNRVAAAKLDGLPGVTSMHFRDWFRPFSPKRGVSPLCWDGSVPHASFDTDPGLN